MLKIKTYIGLVGLDQQLQHFPNNQISSVFIFLIFFDIFSQSKIFLIFFWKQYLSLLSRQCAVDYFRNHMKTECLLSRQTVFPKLKYVVFP